jgi:acyl-CoA thioester hydrolase
MAPMTRTQNPASNESAAIDRPLPLPRAAYRRFVPVTTRWMDNDVYGHLNNVVVYSLFDTAVNGVLFAAGALDFRDGNVVGFVVETGCNYFAPLAFPEPLEAGLRVARVGTSSVRYEIGIFAAAAEETAARGHFIHVYVDRATRRPVDLPERLRSVLKELQ